MFFFFGLWVGELYVLKWEDLDLVCGVINVCWVVWWGYVELIKIDNFCEVVLIDWIREVFDDYCMWLVCE